MVTLLDIKYHDISTRLGGLFLSVNLRQYLMRVFFRIISLNRLMAMTNCSMVPSSFDSASRCH